MRRGAMMGSVLGGLWGCLFSRAPRLGSVLGNPPALGAHGATAIVPIWFNAAQAYLGLEGLPRVRSPDREERLLRGLKTRERAGVFSRLFVVRCRPLVTCDNAAEDTLS